MKHIKNLLDRILEVFSTVIFIAMVGLVSFQVVSRYVFKSPSSISEVVTRYLFVWLILVSATYIFGQREHICISFIKDKLPQRARVVVDIIIEVVTMIFAGTIMVYGGVVITRMNMLQYDSILRIPTGFIYSIIPVCGILIIFYSICNITSVLKNRLIK